MAIGKGGGSTSGGSTRAKYPNWFIDRFRGVPGAGFAGEAGVLPTADQTFLEQSQQPINPQMQQGLQGIENLASQGSPVGQAAQNTLLGILQGGGGQSGEVASTAMGGGYVNPAMAETHRIAMGGDLGSNPFLDQQFQNAARRVSQGFNENVIPQLDQSFVGAGRLGSGQYALMRNRTEEGLANQLGDMATNIYGGAYEADQGRRMGALGQLAGLGQQDVQNRFAGAGLSDANTRQQLGAIGLGGQAFDLQAQPYSALLGAGQFRQDQAWRPTQQYLNTLTGPLQTGTSASMPAPQQNPLANALGGGLGAAALGAGMGLGAPWIGGLGAAGGLAGLLSDMRAKKDIKRVGKTDGGTPIYSYKYKGGDGPTMMGVLAQEVAERQPEAVARRPDGLLSVLYERVA